MSIFLHPPTEVILEVDYESVERNKGQYVVRCREPVPRYFRMPAAFCNNMQQVTATLSIYNNKIRQKNSSATLSITKNAREQLDEEAVVKLEEMI